MTTKTGIIYLQRDRFQLYSPYLPNILEFRFVPELIRDFDLVNRELIENLIKVFLANNKVPASGMVIVIADSASFIKDFVSPSTPPPVVPGQPPTPPPTLEDLHNQANAYLEHVPFELVSSKLFPLATGVRAYATNQEIYEELKSIFEKNGFIIQSVLPGFVFGPNLSNIPSLDGVSVAAILQKSGTVQGYNLLKESASVAEPLPSREAGDLGGAEEKDSVVPEDTSVLEKPENKKVIIAVVISAIVMIVGITGIIIYMQFQDHPYKPTSVPTRSNASSTATPKVTQAAANSQISNLTAEVISIPAAATTAASLRSSLDTFGFKSIVPQTQTTRGLAQNVLVFSPNVSQTVKTTITTVVKNIVPDILVQDKQDAITDVSITLGK